MKMVMCSVYDHKAGVFSSPQLFRSRAEAIRSFTDAVVQEGSQFNKHASDYTFFCVGEWDDSNGSIVSNVEPVISGPECLPR